MELCSDNEIMTNEPLLMINFGAGSEQYSKNTWASFNFTTNYHQSLGPSVQYGQFGFVNNISAAQNGWHTGASDHTENDTNGYMYLVNVDETNSLLFNLTANNMCIGFRYQFSVYLANADKLRADDVHIEPNIRFEVHSATSENQLLAQSDTGNMPATNTIIWSRHSLSFVALTDSVVFLMISNVGGRKGNDIAIDDIELRVCSNTRSGLCPPG